MKLTREHIHQFIDLLNREIDNQALLINSLSTKLDETEQELRDAIKGMNNFESQLLDSEAHCSQIMRELIDLRDKEPIQQELNNIKEANKQLQGGIKELQQLRAQTLEALSEVHEPVEPVMKARKILAGVL